jgi:hypothetical protein
MGYSTVKTRGGIISGCDWKRIGMAAILSHLFEDEQ